MDVDPTVRPDRRTPRRWLVGLIGLSVALTPAGVAVAKPNPPARAVGERLRIAIRPKGWGSTANGVPAGWPWRPRA